MLDCSYKFHPMTSLLSGLTQCLAGPPDRRSPQEQRDMLHKQFWKLVLRSVIRIKVEDRLSVRQVLLKDK